MIATELATYVTPNGPSCRIATLAISHPAEYSDLMEAISPPAGTKAYTHAVVARWWNATRAKATGVEINRGIVARHRGDTKRCLQCR